MDSHGIHLLAPRTHVRWRTTTVTPNGEAEGEIWGSNPHQPKHAKCTL